MSVLVQRGALRRATAVLAVTALTAVAGVLGTGQASAAPATIDRAAFGVSADGVVDIAKTPNCPERFTIGVCDKEVLGFNEFPTVLTADVLTARTRGTADPLRARSRASAAGVNAVEGTLTADLIVSRCTADADGVRGSTTLVGASLLGAPAVDLTPEPNTVLLDALGVRIVLNEQIVTDGGNQIVVNAVHITVDSPLGPAFDQEIIIASSQCSFHPADAPGTGFLEICKRADNGNGAVTGKFRFRFAGQSVTVAVGQCSNAIRVPAGRLTVTEAAKDGTRVSGCATRPLPRLLRCDPADRKAVVRIVEGGVEKETVLFVTNKRTVVGDNVGAIKVCKIAGDGVRVGEKFDFTVGNKNLTVPAGPRRQDGYCKVARGFDRGSNVKVTEAKRRGVRVSRITVRPVERKVSASKADRTATVRVGKGFTVVSFTNTRRN
ncbi:MAG: hypothetical protein M3Q39_16910 [Actinomycetota bacterium]|nr:hypothetical protein [Actinomycetota bacterium]